MKYYYTITELAQELGIKKGIIKGMIKKNKIKIVNVNRKVVFIPLTEAERIKKILIEGGKL